MMEARLEELCAELRAGECCLALLPVWRARFPATLADGLAHLSNAGRATLIRLARANAPARLADFALIGDATPEERCNTILMLAMDQEGTAAASALWSSTDPQLTPEERLAAALQNLAAGQPLVLILVLGRSGTAALLEDDRRLLVALLGSLTDPVPRPTLCLVARENVGLREAAAALGMPVVELEPETTVDQERPC